MYLNLDEVVSKVELLAEDFPSFVQVRTLPYQTHEGRWLHLLSVKVGEQGRKQGVYVQGGTHAREWGTVDTVMHFVEQFLISLRDGTDITYGNRTFAADDVRAAFEGLNLFVLPCVNPDGRAFSMEPGDDERDFPKHMWRKNRRDNGDGECLGVDLNRNFDWMWDFRTLVHPGCLPENYPTCQGLIRVSDDLCHDEFHGPAPFSEPETWDVQSVLDQENIRVFVDVHGVRGRIMFPWADDEVQTTDPEQNFANPAYDGKRGLKDTSITSTLCPDPPNPDGAAYKEFMHAVDQARFLTFATFARDAIRDVAGKNYRTGTSYLEMYGMSGNANDYAYSRHIVNPARGKIDGYIIEVENIGTLGFQPPFEDTPGPNDMIHVIHDIAAGLTALFLNAIRVPTVTVLSGRRFFSQMRVGTSVERLVRLRNDGPRQVDIGSVEFIGDAGPFSVESVSRTRLDPGEQCEISVRAAPTAPGFTIARLAVNFANSGESEVRDVRIVECILSACETPKGACVAPTFPPTMSTARCLAQVAALLRRLVLISLLWPWSKSVRCELKQLGFRLRHCREGNADPCRLL